LGKVESITIEGLDLWFNSSDHLPPHLHASKTGHWEIRVFILECNQRLLSHTVKWSRFGKKPGSQELNEVLKAVLEHRDELLREWERKVVTSR